MTHPFLAIRHASDLAALRTLLVDLRYVFFDPSAPDANGNPMIRLYREKLESEAGARKCAVIVVPKRKLFAVVKQIVGEHRSVRADGARDLDAERWGKPASTMKTSHGEIYDR